MCSIPVMGTHRKKMLPVWFSSNQSNEIHITNVAQLSVHIIEARLKIKHTRNDEEILIL